jgi:hypothetical protein
LANGAFGHPQRRRNLALMPAFLLQIPRAQPPPFAPILANPTSLGHDRDPLHVTGQLHGSV